MFSRLGLHIAERVLDLSNYLLLRVQDEVPPVVRVSRHEAVKQAATRTGRQRRPLLRVALEVGLAQPAPRLVEPRVGLVL